MHDHYMTMPQHKNPCLGGHEIYNIGGPILGHHFFTLTLSDLNLGIEKIFKEIMYFHYMRPHLNIRTPTQWGNEIYNFSRPFLSHHYHALGLSESCPRI